MKHIRHGSSSSILITEAPLSVDEEFSNRRRRYLIMMAGRAISVVAAVAVYKFSPLLAAVFLVSAAVLPWAAVLLANNRPAKQAVRFRRFLPDAVGGPRILTDGSAPPTQPDAQADARGPERIIEL